jgi:hypothetical protein
MSESNEEKKKQERPAPTSFEALGGGATAEEEAEAPPSDEEQTEAPPSNEPRPETTEERPGAPTSFESLGGAELPVREREEEDEAVEEWPRRREEEEEAEPDIRAEALGASGAQGRPAWLVSLYASLLALVVMIPSVLWGFPQFILVVPAIAILVSLAYSLSTIGSPDEPGDRAKAFAGLVISIIAAGLMALQILGE